MRHQLQVVGEPERFEQTCLPLSATANDVRAVVQYLKGKAEGVTLAEAVDSLKKQIFEPEKIAAYESLGIVRREVNRLKLDALGWELARCLEPEADAFRALLDRIEAFRRALDWAHGRRLDYLIGSDVFDFWSDHCPQALGLSTPQVVEANVNCFFQLCQASGLGTHIVGKKGQPTRLRLNHSELTAYVTGARTPCRAGAAGAAPVPARRLEPQTLPGERPGRVLVVCDEPDATTERLGTMLALMDVPYSVIERTPTGGGLLPRELMAAMRLCDSAVILVGAHHLASDDGGLKPEFALELNVALTLYDDRVVILCDEEMARAPALRGLGVCALNDGGLDWESGMHLMRAVKGFAREPQ
ncbi:MAG TPA: hypothetical protein VGX48_10985 [Pyrinomonadaceae bacterium]|jgi:hypothetical protein|nr:hypothetical protein [Pyrinomonadaceae bacterium]